MKANRTDCSLLSQPVSSSVTLCSWSYPMCALPYYPQVSVFPTGGFLSAMISLSVIYFCSEKQFWSMWLIGDVQVLVLELRNRVSCWVFKHKCNNSSSKFQGNGERVRVSRQLQTGDKFWDGQHIRQGILGGLQDTCPKPGWQDHVTSRNLEGTKWLLSAIALILGTPL